MNFELDSDQVALQASLQKFFAQEYSFEKRRGILRASGSSDAIWRALAEQGALGIGLPESQGGFGGAVESMLVMEAIGESLVLEPYLSTVILCGPLIAALGSEEQQVKFLPRIVSGELRLALAHLEVDSRYDVDRIAATAESAAAGFTITGAKSVVLDGGVADCFLVSAMLGRTTTLFAVPADAAGLSVTRYRTHDGRTAADLKLAAVKVSAADRLGTGDALPAIRHAVDRATAALCAEAVGAMEALNRQTLEYLKTRVQFGQPIGRFQALQHRMADLFVWATQARSMSYYATGHATDPDEARRRRALSSAKAFIGKAARAIGQEAVQLHGGMGMTDELAVSHYFKRLTLINATFGDVDHHMACVSDAILEGARS